MTYNPEKHHRSSIRLPGYDYSRPGYYYVTICSRNREEIFSDYHVGAAFTSALNSFPLSIAGKIIQVQLKEIEKQYENVQLDETIIMPNHIHIILQILKGVEANHQQK